MYVFYIAFKYLKNFVFILLSLSAFYVIIDLIANFQKLPSSSNLVVLYIYYILLYSFDMFYSLALVFAFLLTLYHMIKFNELVSFYSLGFSVKKILKPFLMVGGIVFIFFLMFEFTKFAYFREYANAILSNKQHVNSDLFVKYKDRVVFMKKLNPLIKTAYDIKVFYLKDFKVYKILVAKEAKFKDDVWEVKKAYISFITPSRVYHYVKDVKILKDFKPKIISNLKQLNSISLYDAILAIKIFKDVNVSILLSIVLFKIFSALNMICLIVIFLILSPIHPRVANVSVFLVKSVLFTILLWGSELMIFKFAKQGVLNPYVLILPFLLVCCYSIYLFYKEK